MATQTPGRRAIDPSDIAAETETDRPTEHHRIAIVGSGFAGLGAAIRLKQTGIEDFVVLEAGDDVGGTWNFNTYPGCQCDIPSHLYSFSFAPNPNWSRTYSKQPEIWEYLRRCSREHDIDRHVRLRSEVVAAHWNEADELWHIQIATGGGDGDGEPALTTAGALPGEREPTTMRELTAEVLVAGAGPLNEPKLPDIPGIDDFQGTIFHSARWNHEHDPQGERVAVIGTGASAIQFVPHLQQQVAKLHVFQRTPPWVVPHRDRPTKAVERWLYRHIPPLQRLVRAGVYGMRELFALRLMHPLRGSLPERVAQRHLHAQVADPQLRARLAPDYRIGCKRVLISNDYYPALQKPNVELVTDSVSAIEPHAIVTADGARREVDTIVLGTGFHVTDMPVANWIYGRGGRSLADVWQGSPQAYLGSTVAGFPNMFLLVGPNMGLGHNSIVFMIEAQLNYLLGALRTLAQVSSTTDASSTPAATATATATAGGNTSGAIFEVRDSVMRAFNAEIQHHLRGSVWTSGGCQSWYIDERGRNTTIWPGFTWRYYGRTRHFNPSDYTLRVRRAAPARAALAVA
jgi:cation diffusion facilitator CzcD-associated flavoprotein CzcO